MLKKFGTFVAYLVISLAFYLAGLWGKNSVKSKNSRADILKSRNREKGFYLRVFVQAAAKYERAETEV